MNKELKKNFTYAFIAQGISLIVSCLTNLILPKVLSVTSFSYWQLFIFYSTYIPCLALGLNDGIYLRYGGFHIDELDYKSVKSQYMFGIIFQTFLGIVVGGFLILFSKSLNRRLIIALVIVYFLVYTCHNFLGYIFQATNLTNIYSKSIIIQRIVFLFVEIELLFLVSKNVFEYIPYYIFSLFCALLYLSYKIYPYFKLNKIDLKYGYREAWISMKTGISLMIANVCSMLILGVGRQIIDVRWGLLAFGKISFSLTLMNFALTFIMQIGLVLFPALRRLDSKNLQRYYRRLTFSLFYLLPLMYITYLPMQFVLKLWLPQYTQSINYLALVLPICYFDSRMDLIGNTFFKVLNKQVLLLKINILTILVSGVLGLLSAYLFNNMNFVIIGLVIAIVFRSVISDILLSHDIKLNVIILEISDIVLAIVFMLSANILNWWISVVLLLIVYIIRVVLVKIKVIKIKSVGDFNYEE